jgi:glycosyltransferase involved in cell wall biosynthesis
VNILFLTAYPPVLDMHGGGVRMYHNIRLLGRKHNVHVVSFVENDDEFERVSAIAGICDSVEAVRRTGGAAPRRLSSIPSQVSYFDTPEIREAIDEACRRHAIDVLQCEYVEMAQFHRSDMFTIWSIIDPLSPGLRQRFESETRPIEKARWFYRWKSMLNYETRSARRFDRVVTMTPGDADYMRRRAPRSDIRDTPIGVDSRHFSPLEADPAGPVRVIFLGNFRHAPNLEAVQFLKDELAPAFSDLSFEVAGGNLPPDVLDGSGVRYLGYQSDTRPLYRRPNTIVVAPIFSGRGQRVKLLEAFSMGVPVVSTSLGAAGFPVRDGKDAFIAETPGEFRSVLALLRDSQELRENIGAKAREMILARFDWDILAERFLKVVEPGRLSVSRGVNLSP